MNHSSDQVKGIQGYADHIPRFIESSQYLNFFEVCQDFVPHLPSSPANILDVGAGVGQNAAALSELGHKVTAVEPMPEFLQAAKNRYQHLPVTWLSDALPDLTNLSDNLSFEFILADAMFHHLTTDEQAMAMQRLSELMSPGGKLAISLRNGPPGMGTFVHPTSPENTINAARKHGLSCLLQTDVKPSIYSFKKGVTWFRLVFQK